MGDNMKFQNYYFQETTQNQKFVVVYSGRFQPFHIGHKETYDNLVRKFGKDKVYIATSDKVEMPKSPFNFQEKKKIITRMFSDIPVDKIVMVKNPYTPKEILQEQPEETVYITAVGEKDSDRLSGKYFQKYEDNKDMKPYKEAGYVYITPENTKYYNKEKISGTLVRDVLSTADNDQKEDLFKVLYPRFNKEIFDLIVNKISGENEGFDFGDYEDKVTKDVNKDRNKVIIHKSKQVIAK
jgi:phosphopantetheine adenylyltransferase